MAVSDKKSYRVDDMILQIDKNVDPKEFHIRDYEKFIDVLCGTREYQKEALRAIFTYLFNKKYSSILDMARENYGLNGKIRDRFQNISDYLSTFQLPEKKSASVDLPTAAGKSYVMYGVARIALASGLADRVLILCPSVTIESGLTEKFVSLIADADLNGLLKSGNNLSVPSIINGNETFISNSICIENFHSILPSSGSSIRESLRGMGARTLILNDECHHVYNSAESEVKKWKEFLNDAEFGFQNIIGFSGTCYIGNDYFPDVIYRLPLLSLIEMGFGKDIDYVMEDSSEDESEKFQKIYGNHLENKTRYKKTKPITIFVTRDIESCKRLAAKFSKFLVTHEKSDQADIDKKVIIATSAKEHFGNLSKLRLVDEISSPVEWIFSVSMLSEGWDVKNVFQIVPHEERAFNSKLLISQVLGRGLRVPDEYRGERPTVKVFNHSSWSPRIKNLVDSLLEIENRIQYGPCEQLRGFAFEIHRLTTRVDVVESGEIGGGDAIEFTDESLSVRDVALVSQEKYLDKATVYERIGASSNATRSVKTKIEYRMHPIADVARHIYSKIQNINIEKGIQIYEKYDIEFITRFIQKHLEEIGETSGLVSDKNVQILQSAFQFENISGSTKLRYTKSPGELTKISTFEIPSRSLSVSSLRSGEGSIFIHEKTADCSREDSRTILYGVIKDETLPRSAVTQIPNRYDYKTPLSLVTTYGKPERDFVKRLISSDISSLLDGWVKSSDKGFYTIPYSLITGGLSRDREFNPDFFIKIKQNIFVVEIKDDSEISIPSDSNRAKYLAGREYFDEINRMQGELVYHFNFVTPSDFDLFFSHIARGQYTITTSLDSVFLNDMRS